MTKSELVDRVGVRVFYNVKDSIKAAVMEEAERFCEMIDCVDDPVSLNLSSVKHGVKVRMSIDTYSDNSESSCGDGNG